MGDRRKPSVGLRRPAPMNRPLPDHHPNCPQTPCVCVRDYVVRALAAVAAREDKTDE